ncbi:aldehyde ferredoxin oxidoreductase family protein [Halobacterium rubrum]|uniref:aldehyde ferredoxin oxidoreductase family protein n=1 Tax=Halobacterium TaxID=2239 RepID=UPI001F44749A|nr:MULTISPECIES: aldehyde ferredoxin oxidoreductase C-terminal domain-containing protein [Halobacterium]MDH5020429.1 aldehyde ferredoxin oxidoreductase C-terminal domain-containing protein [Halobacterium rubrum]
MTERSPRRLLRVDLGEETVESEPVPEAWLRRYLGGKGLGARYLYDELDAGVDPLGPENALLFLLGPLSGLLPGESRYAAVTKSPLTGGFLDSYAGGQFPGALAGALPEHVGVLVTGVAEEPVRLVVRDDDATLEPAGTWGSDTAETAAAFPDAEVACIGPAGENRVAYATIASDGGEHHAGRGGAGAVMGSKRLKAVVAHGDPPSGLAALRESYAERFREDATGRWLDASGTVETVDFADEVGALATRGWRDSEFEGSEDVGVAAVRERAVGRERDEDTGQRGFHVDTDAGESVPRGATAMSLGAGLGIDDFDAVAALGETCNRLGVDLVSAGSAIAWAVRASVEGYVGRPLAFGDADDAREVLGEIARRETDLGAALADGVDAAAQRYGGEAFAPTVKAMELPAYDPRGAASMALAYATSDRGACHRRALPVEREVFDGEWSPERAARGVVAEQDRRSVLWSLVVDDFVGDVFDDLGAEWLDAAGVDYAGDLETLGERVWTLTRLFNVREGVSRADDSLPAVLRGPPEAGGDADSGDAGGVDPERFEAMLDAYYERRGWSRADGRPTRETVERLGLGGVVDDATPLGAPGD